MNNGRESGIYIPDYLFTELRLTRVERFVFALIYSYSQGGGSFFATKDYVAERIGYSVRSVYKAFATLLERGLVIEHVANKYGRTYKSFTINEDLIEKHHQSGGGRGEMAIEGEKKPDKRDNKNEDARMAHSAVKIEEGKSAASKSAEQGKIGSSSPDENKKKSCASSSLKTNNINKKDETHESKQKSEALNAIEQKRKGYLPFSKNGRVLLRTSEYRRLRAACGAHPLSLFIKGLEELIEGDLGFENRLVNHFSILAGRIKSSLGIDARKIACV